MSAVAWDAWNPVHTTWGVKQLRDAACRPGNGWSTGLADGLAGCAIQPLAGILLPFGPSDTFLYLRGGRRHLQSAISAKIPESWAAVAPELNRSNRIPHTEFESGAWLLASHVDGHGSFNDSQIQ